MINQSPSTFHLNLLVMKTRTDSGPPKVEDTNE